MRNLTKQFGGVRALDAVSLDVQPGSIHAIVGPNGSGKTTLLNLISGFYPASAGSIRLDGVEVSGLGPTAIARLSVQRSFQTPKLLGELSVLENVRFGGYARERAGHCAAPCARALRSRGVGRRSDAMAVGGGSSQSRPRTRSAVAPWATASGGNRAR